MAIPIEVRHIDPDWADCVGGINGVYDPPIALTPAGAIAKPTMPGRVSETASGAVPASTARPTLATVTSALGSDRVPAKPSSSKAQKPRPNNPRVGESSTVLAQADGEQTDRQDSFSEDHATISSENVLPTENSGDAGDPPLESTVLGEPVSKPNSPNDRSKSHGTNAAPEPQTNALSVFLEGQSSIDASIRQQGSIEKTQRPGLPATQFQLTETFESASSGMKSSAGPGSEVSLDSHAMGAASDGGAIIITDHSATNRVPSSNVRSPALATFLAGGHAITAYRQGAAVILADGTQILIAQHDSVVVIASHTIDVADDGHALIIGSSSVDIPVSKDFEGDVSATVQVVDGPAPVADEATFLHDGQQLIASAAKDGIVIQQGTSKITLAAGQETTFHGHSLSALQSGPALIVDGSVTNFTPTGFPNGSSKKIETASDSQSADTVGSAGATDTVEVTTSRSSTRQSSTTPENAALGSMAGTSLFLRLLCLLSCLWASVVSV